MFDREREGMEEGRGFHKPHPNDDGGTKTKREVSIVDT